MRVVAGEFGGRVIDSPSEKTTRPTTDRVRESMFSSIYSRLADLSGTRVLDAFAGSGALGIEALSRGAQRAVFFERDANARKVLEGNLSSLGLKLPRATVAGRDVVSDAAAGAVLLGGRRTASCSWIRRTRSSLPRCTRSCETCSPEARSPQVP